MADFDNTEEKTAPRGADWEVVHMTASTYAAAPGATEANLVNKNYETKKTERVTHEPSRALFMSDHFVFPPSEHENLPIEPEVTEIPGGSESVSTDWNDDSIFQDDHKEKLHATSRNDPYQLEPYEEQDTAGYMAYTEDKEVQRLNLDEKDEGEAPLSPRQHSKHDEERKSDGSSLPSEASWKRHATSVYHHAKEGSTLWSIVLAATVVGIVIWGHRWQQGKWQFHQNKWRFSVPDESMRRMLGRHK